MKKILLNNELLTNLFTEESSNFITLDKIIEELNKDIQKGINNNSFLNMDHLSFNLVNEIMFNGTYKLFNIYIDIYNDIKIVRSKKTGKALNYELLPYVYRIQVYYNNISMYFYINVDKIRSKRIIEVEK